MSSMSHLHSSNNRSLSDEPEEPGIAAVLPAEIIPDELGASIIPVSADPSKVGSNVTILAAAQLITWTMTLLWTLVVPRTLGPSGMGILMSAWSITGIFGVLLGLGTRNYLVRMSVSDPGSAGERIGTAIVLRMLLSPLLLGAAVLYGELVDWSPEATHVLYLAAFATIFIQIAEPFQAAFQSIERMEYLAYSEIISKSGQGLLGIAVVLLGFGTLGVTACWTATSALVIVLDAYWLRGKFKIVLRTSARRMFELARESLPYWAFGVFFVLYRWIDFVMLSLLTRPEVVGWYSVPTRLFQTLMFLPVVVSTAWLPRFVRGFEEGERALRETARQPLELVLLISLPICSATAVAAAPFIHLLYGDAYRQSVPVLIILGFCIPPTYLNIVLSQVLIAMNRQTTWTWVMAVATLVNPLLNVVLIPAAEHLIGNGAVGAATALLITELVVVSAGFMLVGHLVFDQGTIRRTILSSITAGAMWGISFPIDRLFGGIASIVASAITFFVLATLLGLFTPDEIAMLKDSIRRVGRKFGRRGGSRIHSAAGKT